MASELLRNRSAARKPELKVNAQSLFERGGGDGWIEFKPTTTVRRQIEISSASPGFKDDTKKSAKRRVKGKKLLGQQAAEEIEGESCSKQRVQRSSNPPTTKAMEKSISQVFLPQSSMTRERQKGG